MTKPSPQEIPPAPGRLRALLASRRAALLLAAACAALAAVVAWNCLNQVSDRPAGHDSGIFSACALHTLEGRAIYRQAWDHKPPMVYMLDALALKLGDGTINAIRTMERLFAAAGALGLFLLVRRVYASSLLALGATLLGLFLFYWPATFEEGNFTEEYAAIMVLAAALCCELSLGRPGEAPPPAWRARLWLGLAGAGFAAAGLTKEPFFFSALPWAAYALLRGWTSWRAAAARAGWMALGCLVPVLAALAWLGAQGSIGAWGEIISYNLGYAYAPEPGGSLKLAERLVGHGVRAWVHGLYLSRVGLVAVLLGLGGLAWRSFLRRHGFFPLAAAAGLVGSFLGIALSGKFHGHYYMQLAPAVALVAAGGGALAVEAARSVRWWFPAIGAALLALVFYAWDLDRCWYFHRLLARPGRPYAGDEPVAAELRRRARPGDELWAPDGNRARLYLETRMLCPTRHLYAPDLVLYGFKPGSQQAGMRELRADLQARPPRFMVLSELSDLDFYAPVGLRPWVEANYVEACVGRGQEGATRIL
jgi:4-amino-4-deoxy-L-arabinose transferase-like glycosyltransferase